VEDGVGVDDGLVVAEPVMEVVWEAVTVMERVAVGDSVGVTEPVMEVVWEAVAVMDGPVVTEIL